VKGRRELRITHTEYSVEIFFACRTRASARRVGHQFTRRTERSISDAILRAARKKVREHIRAGRLAKGFCAAMVS
jgi:hypothetical protein